MPPRKSLRLQFKEAEVLTLPPEPRGTLVYEQVKCLTKTFTFQRKNQRVYFYVFLCVKVTAAEEDAWSPVYGTSQHGGGKQTAHPTS